MGGAYAAPPSSFGHVRVVERQALRRGKPAVGHDPVFLPLAVQLLGGHSLAGRHSLEDHVADHRTVDRTAIDGRARRLRGLGGMAQFGCRALPSSVALVPWLSESRRDDASRGHWLHRSGFGIVRSVARVRRQGRRPQRLTDLANPVIRRARRRPGDSRGPATPTRD